MQRLAIELGVTDRTIRNDITALTVDYPLETEVGRHGCVKLADWYHPHRNILSREQTSALIDLLDKADEPLTKILREMLTEFGSMATRELVHKGLIL